MEREGFSLKLKERVRQEQNGECGVCYRQEPLTVHHIKPKSQGGPNVRDNALGVGRTPCHDVLDEFALEKKIYYPEVLMEKDFWYKIVTIHDAQDRNRPRKSLAVSNTIYQRRRRR